MISQAIKETNRIEAALRRFLQQQIKLVNRIMTLAQVIPGQWPIGQNACAAIAFPPKGGLCQSHHGLIRPGESKGIYAGGTKNIGQPGGMTKGVGLPRHFGTLAEACLKVTACRRELPREGFRSCEIGIRLNEGSPHHIPPALTNLCHNTGKGCGIELFNVLVDRGFPANECQVFKFIHQIEDRPDGGNAFREPLAPIPQPDGIEVGVGEKVDGGVAFPHSGNSAPRSSSGHGLIAAMRASPAGRCGPTQ